MIAGQPPKFVQLNKCQRPSVLGRSGHESVAPVQGEVFFNAEKGFGFISRGVRTKLSPSALGNPTKYAPVDLMRGIAPGVAPDPARPVAFQEKSLPEQPRSAPSAAADFRALAIQIREAGLLDRRSGYYRVKIVLTVAAFGIGWASLLVVGNSWATLGIAAFLGVTFTQLAFLCHDAGHQQVFRSRRANWVLGLALGNALMGLSFGWWISKHNAHHAHPNDVDRDPDIGAGVAMAARWQAGLFFPLMVLRSAGLHVAGMKKLIRQRDAAAAMEGSLMALHVALYLTTLAWVLSPLRALAFIGVQQAVFSVYLGCSFAPNHKGMPLIEGNPVMSFAQRQVITARNVAGGRFTDLVIGGLNYQIEHHLFPMMPRPNLRRAQSIVRAFCLENGFGYCEASLVGSFRQVVHHLRATSAALPAPLGGLASIEG
jgi:fatty acid desaturase